MRAKGGVGVTLLTIDYMQQCAAHLTTALSDAAPLGQSTRAMLRVERLCLGNVSTMSANKEDTGFVCLVRAHHQSHDSDLLCRIPRPRSETGQSCEACMPATFCRLYIRVLWLFETAERAVQLEAQGGEQDRPNPAHARA